MLADSFRNRFAQWMVIAETCAYLLLARLALRIFSFRQLTWFFNMPVRGAEKTGQERTKAIQTVRKNIHSASRRILPGSTCLHKAIAAQSMLRRRNISCTLYYGARTFPGKGLEAHAWVQDGPDGVIGMQEVIQNGYKAIVCFPLQLEKTQASVEL